MIVNEANRLKKKQKWWKIRRKSWKEFLFYKAFWNLNSNSNDIQIFKKCMRYHWHCINSACSVIDTRCKVHAVSLTPDAQCMHAKKFSNNFEKGKSYEKRQCYAKKVAVSMTLDAWCMQGKWHHMHAGSLTPLAWQMIRIALATFEGNIYQKQICSQIVLPHL
jgi:hypothetical protein